jgi:hypothetical protein
MPSESPLPPLTAQVLLTPLVTLPPPPSRPLPKDSFELRPVCHSLMRRARGLSFM